MNLKSHAARRARPNTTTSRSRHSGALGARMFALVVALVACVAGCASAPASPGTGDGAAAGKGFAPNPAVCPRSLGIQSAVQTLRPTAGSVSLTAAAEALAAAGYVSVTRTDDLGLADAVAASDERGDVVVVAQRGELAVVSSCALDGLGQMHRLDDGLARLADAVAGLAGSNHAAATRRWALPAGIYGAAGSYWRQAAGTGLDLNAATTGTLSLTADAQLGFVIAGASHPESVAGDVVGVQELALEGSAVVTDEKHTVQGPASLRWELPAGVAGSQALALHLLVTDASLRWQVGAWIPYVEAWFGATDDLPEAATVALSLQGALPGAIRKSQPVSALKLPAALTQVGER